MMAMLINCKTNKIIVLAYALDQMGIYRFKSEAQSHPGLWFTIKTFEPINLQIIDKVKERIPNYRNLEVVQDYSEIVDLPNAEEQATLFLAHVLFDESSENSKEVASWQTLPELLRNMPKNRNRLVYLKAFQFLNGSHKDRIKVIETDDPVKFIEDNKNN